MRISVILRLILLFRIVHSVVVNKILEESKEERLTDKDEESFIRVEENLAETAEDVENAYIKNHYEPKGCPGTDGCLHCCPIGRKRDGRGCFTCECKRSGNFEGDIQIKYGDYWQLMQHYDPSSVASPPGAKDAINLARYEWPKTGKFVLIPYTLHSTITGKKESQIKEAISRYNKRTCIRFVKRKSQKDFVEFYGLGGCSSNIGRTGGKQQITIGRNCEIKLGTVIHEMMHALGFWHEQSRGDRDNHVTIVWDNIMDVTKKNFEKQEKFWENYGSPYDLGSVMHYGGEYFAKRRGLATILNKKTGKMVKAQRENFSDEDVKQINLKYKCSDYLSKKDLTKLSLKTRSCEDKIFSSICEAIKDRGFCSSFDSRCQKTCGSCLYKNEEDEKIVEECRDKLSSCERWSKEGFCAKYENYMQSQCKKSCGLCKQSVLSKNTCRDTLENCKEWSEIGYCKSTKYSVYMMSMCRHSCGVCSLPEQKVISFEADDVELYTGTCGKVDSNLKFTIAERVVGGKPSFYGSIPWQASLFDESYRHICGATLISSKHLLTAAHCFSRIADPKPESYHIYLGKYHRDKNYFDKGQVEAEISQIIIHPNYNSQTNDNDIAIITTKDEVVFTNYIRPVCLPSPNSQLNIGSLATVSGWGETRNLVNTKDLLQSADVKIISNNICNKWLEKLYGRSNDINKHMICAGYKEGKKDACQGDSGGPLVSETDGKKVLVGLVSWGYGCGETHRPGVYTKVQAYLDWISKFQNKKKI